MRDVIASLTSVRINLWLSDLSINPEVRRSLKSDDLIIETKDQVDRTIDPRWELARKWFLELKYSANSEDVIEMDINETLSEFTDEEIKTIIIPNLCSLALTSGCNWACYFCVTSPERWVKSIFSLDSLKIFFKKYSDEIIRFVLYDWWSDPFDYNTNNYDFLDLLKILDEDHAWKFHFISTVIPKWSQNLFIETFFRLFSQYLNDKGRHELRISVTEDNIQRVETIFFFIEKLVQDYEIPIESFNEFLKDKILFHSRFKDWVDKLWKQIKKNDDYKFAGGSSCTDNIQISPSKWVSRYLMQSSNKYSPYWDIKLKGPIEKEFKYFHIDYAKYSKYIKWAKRYKLLPSVEWKFNRDIPEELVTILSRELRCLDSLLDNYRDWIFEDDREWQKEYIEILDKMYNEYSKDRKAIIWELLSKASSFVNNQLIDIELREELAYYIDLLNFYTKKVDTIYEIVYWPDLISVEHSIQLWLFIKELWKDHVNNFDQIIKDLFLESKVEYPEFETTLETIIKIYNKLKKYFKEEAEFDFSVINAKEDFWKYLPAWLYYAASFNIKD